MIGDNARGLIASARKMAFPTRMNLNINAEPLKLGETPDLNPNVISTYGQYHLTYNVYARTGELNKKRFAIVVDFGKGYFKFGNWVELYNQQFTNDYIKFILKYTNINKDFMQIAVENEGMHIPLTFDVLKFDADVRKKAGITDKTKRIRCFNPFVADNGLRDEELVLERVKKEAQAK